MRITDNPVSRYLLIVSALVAAFYSLILLRARQLFEEDTPMSVAAAVRLAPYSTDYLTRLAAWKQQPEKTAILRRSVELNPFDFQSLIQIGFAYEFEQHDTKLAEHCYLQAAAVNKMFLPKWTLANFYFRHDEPSEFFRWATLALAITPFSPEPVFTQMWIMSQDGARIGNAVPDRPRVLAPYAWFLSNNHQYDAIPPVIQRLVHAVGKGDPRVWGRDDLLATIEDRLVAEGYRDSALSVWTSLVRAGWLQQTIPSSDHPITNGQFTKPFFRHGFDWIMADPDGVRLEQIPSASILRIEFSGEEADHSVLLQQYVPMEGGRVYDLRWQPESHLADQQSGLSWRVRGVGDPSGASLVSADLTQIDQHSWSFRAPPGAKLCLLTLEYSRPMGHVRAKGRVLLKAVTSRAE